MWCELQLARSFSSGRRLLTLATLLALRLVSADYTLVDAQKVPVSGDASRAVVRFTAPAQVAEERCDVLVAGAGMGGIGAALAVARHGLTACLTEETDWIGGQATAGGVSALDENKFIEISGGSRSYYEFRNELIKNPTGRVLKYKLREQGVTPATWDRESAGIIVRRRK